MPKVFISYARANKPDIDQLAQHLNELGWDPWVDSSLHGGQEWWEEILRQIETCDIFIAIMSREALISEACEREFDWAEALGKRVLPVAVEPPPTALPGRYSRRQFVDYSEPGNRDRAALKLSRALSNLHSAPPPPPPRFRPRPPAAPLSYLTDLFDLVSSRNALDHGHQRQALFRLEAALRSDDPRERQGGREVLERFRRREDLYADVDRRIGELNRLHVGASSVPTAKPRPKPPPKPHPLTGPIPDHGFRQSRLGLPATLIAVAAIAGAIPPIYLLRTDYPPDSGKIWYWQVISRVLIGIAFCILAGIAMSLADKFAMCSAVLMAGVMVLHVVTETLGLTTDFLDAEVYRLLRHVAYPTVLGLAALVGILFGAAVIRKHRVAWASVLIAWGLCGLWEAYLSREAKIAPWQPGDPPAAAWKAADSVLIVQNLILLAVAILMYRQSRSTAARAD